MATHSSVLAWRIPGMGEPGGLGYGYGGYGYGYGGYGYGPGPGSHRSDDKQIDKK